MKEIEPLTDLKIKQKEFLIQQYPMLDDLMIDTVLRMKPEQINNLVYQIKNGELKHEDPLSPEDYIIKSVSVE